MFIAKTIIARAFYSRLGSSCGSCLFLLPTAGRREAADARTTWHEEEALDDAQDRGVVVVVVQRRELPAAEVGLARCHRLEGRPGSDELDFKFTLD